MEDKTNGYCKTKKEVTTAPNNLLLFRQQANISQGKLAEAVDCSRRTIGCIEQGIHIPSIQMAYRIAAYFEVATEKIFPDKNQPLQETVNGTKSERTSHGI